MNRHVKTALLRVFKKLPKGSKVNMPYLVVEVLKLWKTSPTEYKFTEGYLRACIRADRMDPNGTFEMAKGLCGGVWVRADRDPS